MITKAEVLAVATETKLEPTTAEKDYVLSWILHGISKHAQLSQWIFKGGTCLKKCYFETYRFSEDLDFTVPKGAIYGADEIKEALGEVVNAIYEETGIEARTREIEVEESFNKKKAKTFVAKLTYSGPLALPSKSLQRIKFDITDDEVIAEDPDLRAVFHSYSDAPKDPARVKCYSVNEILAEKTRAIYERQGRARDVFDVVNISRNFREDVSVSRARSALAKKFGFKELLTPSVDLVFDRVDLEQLRANWDAQLKHQLPVLPPVESFYSDLPPALSWWIDEKPIEPKLQSVASQSKGEDILERRHFPEARSVPARRIGVGHQANNISFGQPWAGYLDQIRYAARNRLSVRMNYHGTMRLMEPYSLRRPKTGNLLLYVFETLKGGGRGEGVKAYKVSDIQNVEVTQQAFSPRYAVEL